MSTSRRDLILLRMIREQILPAPPPSQPEEAVPLRAFLYGVDRAPPSCSAEAPGDESPPPWKRRKA